jgi:hypothetical protein
MFKFPAVFFPDYIVIYCSFGIVKIHNLDIPKILVLVNMANNSILTKVSIVHDNPISEFKDGFSLIGVLSYLSYREKAFRSGRTSLPTSIK